MERTITATDLAEHLASVLDRVRDRGERFVIERDGEPVATLVPAAAPPGITVRELIARVGNLDSPGDGFAEDLEFARAAQSQAGLPPWPS